MADPAIRIIPTEYHEVLALLRSETLRSLEEEIAAAAGYSIREDYSSVCTSHRQADMSVSGLTASEIAALLAASREQIVRFAIACLRGSVVARGERPVLGAGFGISHAIQFNFLVHRTPAEFRAYLKNRRTPNAARVIRELRAALDSVAPPT